MSRMRERWQAASALAGVALVTSIADEAATRHRKPPAAFGPVKTSPAKVTDTSSTR